jgi:hypothetical protein
MPAQNNLNGQQFPLEPGTWVDGEPVSLSEIHQAAGFTKRDPAYLLEKHKAKQERKKK